MFAASRRLRLPLYADALMHAAVPPPPLTLDLDGQKASTLPFRRAVWYYAQRVKGVFHTDYDYSEPNKVRCFLCESGT